MVVEGMVVPLATSTAHIFVFLSQLPIIYFSEMTATLGGPALCRASL
jgi:hypothetical protein